MFRSLRTTLHPAWYHGHAARLPFFEGWYYKLIDPTEQHRYAIIPGIFKGTDAQPSHAFIQILDGMTGHVTYHQYPVEAFWAATDAMDVRIGPNRFQLHRVHLELDSPERRASSELRFTGLTSWPVTLLSPGVMGWYAWVPFMETYHGVLGLDHTIHGTLEIDGKQVDLTCGRGYIEKDWGRSFPAAWIWLQSNHFDQVGTSLSASVARIPWLWSSFRGFIVGLWHEDHLYRFATYTGARIERLVVDPKNVDLTLESNEHRLELCARRSQTGTLRGPSGADMGIRVPQTLQAKVAVRLFVLNGGGSSPIFEGTGRNAGMEIGGDVALLL